jgi:hypothetical protein
MIFIVDGVMKRSFESERPFHLREKGPRDGGIVTPLRMDFIFMLKDLQSEKNALNVSPKLIPSKSTRNWH